MDRAPQTGRTVVTEALTLVASRPFRSARDIGRSRSFDPSAIAETSRFEIHREPEVSVTSTLFCGGDWQWQLCSAGGVVLAEAGGFRSERACRAAIAAIQVEAALASVQLRS